MHFTNKLKQSGKDPDSLSLLYGQGNEVNLWLSWVEVWGFPPLFFLNNYIRSDDDSREFANEAKGKRILLVILRMKWETRSKTLARGCTQGIPPPFFSSFCIVMNKMATLHKNEIMGGRGKRLIVIVRIRRVKGGLKIFWQDRRVTWRGSALGEEHERGNNEKRNAYNEVLFLWL